MSNSRNAPDSLTAGYDAVLNALGRLYTTLRRSFLLSMAFAGLLLVFVGFAIPNGVFRAFLYIWGVSAIVGALVIYASLGLLRRVR